MDSSGEPQAPRKSTRSRSRHWYHLRHPFRLVYQAVVAVVGAVIITLIIAVVFNQPIPGIDKSPVVTWAKTNPLPSAAIALVVLVAAGLGWWFDTHQGNEDPTHVPLPFVRDLRAVSFKMGDDVAAEMPFVVAPIQSVYQHTVDILSAAKARAPGAKNGLIVFGVANAGKTRLAFEVTKKVLPGWRALIWRPGDPQPATSQIEDQDIVIFIDDLQEHAPAQMRFARGAVQTLDTRALDLQKMEQLVRSHARRVILVATCRSENELRTRARLGWLLGEVEAVKMPLFPVTGPEAERIINEFRKVAPERVNDRANGFDGTIGSILLGLSAKSQSYAELAADHDPAVRVLQAMKLLSLAGIETHTTVRLRTICSQIFHQADLATEEGWQDAVQKLLELEFVTEGPHEDVLIIKKDVYFEDVITDYPSPNRPQQLERDLERAAQAMMAIHDVEADFYLGNALYRTKQYDAALAAYDFVLSVDDHTEIVPTVVVWRNKGAVLRSRHRYDEALAAYDRAIALDANYASAWRNRGGVLVEMGRYDEALAAFNRALAIDPTYAQAWNGKGRALAKQGKFLEAKAACDNAVKYDPTYDFAWRNLGDILSSLDKKEEAVHAYDRALAISPTYAYAFNGKGVALRELAYLNEALAAFDSAIENDSTLFYAYNGRGATLRDMKQYDEALAALDQCLTMNSNYASAWKNKGTVLNAMGRYSEALDSFDYALGIDPRYIAALQGKATALRGLGRTAEAMVVDEALAHLKPEDEPSNPAPLIHLSLSVTPSARMANWIRLLRTPVSTGTGGDGILAGSRATDELQL
jgi:tetratricopeptide (TPR) repeat protein